MLNKLDNFFHVLSRADIVLLFFKIKYVKKIFKENCQECQTVWIQIRPTIVSTSGPKIVGPDKLGQFVCNFYQYTTKGDTSLLITFCKRFGAGKSQS